MRPQDWLGAAEDMTSSRGLHIDNYQRAEKYRSERPDDVLGWALTAAGLPDDQHHRAALVLRARYHTNQQQKERT